CCVSLELDKRDIDQDGSPDDVEIVDGEYPISEECINWSDLMPGHVFRWRSSIDTPFQLVAHICVLAEEPAAAYMARSLPILDGPQPPIGFALPDPGVMLLASGVNASTWAHEFGHLQGL